MSVWKVMNWVAWAVSALLLGIMIWDFIKVEKARRAAKPQSDDPRTGTDDGRNH